MKYRKKPIDVDAYQVFEPTTVLTDNGSTVAKPRDWVLTDPRNGDTWPVEEKYFAANYVQVPGD